MSRKYPVGVTLTLEEKQRIGFDVRPVRLFGQTMEGEAGTTRRSPLLKEHTCEAQMPDGSLCEVQYQRDGPRFHRFAYRSPVWQTVLYMRTFANTEAAIQEKAQELAATAFLMAQRAEQKEMQRVTAPPGRKILPLPPDVRPLRVKAARQWGGLYAVCLRYPSGVLVPCGALHLQPEAAQREHARYVEAAEAENGGRNSAKRVIGICCRWQKRWVQAAFLARLPLGDTFHSVTPQPDMDADEVAVDDEGLENEDLDGEEEWDDDEDEPEESVAEDEEDEE